MKVHMIEKIFERISTFFEDFFIFLQFNCSKMKLRNKHKRGDSRWGGSLFGFCCRESVENLIHKHSYARSPIRTYTGDEESLSEDGHAVHSRGESRSCP